MESSDEMGTSTNHTLVQTLKKDDSQLILPKSYSYQKRLQQENTSSVFSKSQEFFGWKDCKGQAAFAPKVPTNSSNFIIRC
jgi:hypothetical protein